jgi:Zn-dependent protease
MQEILIEKSPKVQVGPVTFSEIELRDIVKSWIIVSLAFAFVLTDGLNQIMTTFLISALTVGVGFIFHELGHKIMAQRYGAWAEFRSFDQMLIIGLLMAIILHAVFIAPGAVMIYGRTIGKKRNGIISAMGPIMNFIMALMFLPFMIFYKEGILSLIGSYGFSINTWLGLFNLIPFAMFDGKKIWDWNKVVYFMLVILALGLMAFNSFYLRKTIF